MGRVLGKDKIRRSVFQAIYGRHSKPADIDRIMDIANLDESVTQQVRNSLNLLTQNKIISCISPDSKAGFRKKRYEKSPWVNARRSQILKAADNKTWREGLPTKERPQIVQSGSSLTTKIIYHGAKISVQELTIDDIDSFEKVQGIGSSLKRVANLSEDNFKKGILKLIGEEGIFKDWGGEQSDVMTTRLRYNGKRIAAAFALKGPGLKNKLVPGNMGKNGDQAMRLFGEASDIYIVQHWREIAPSVRILLNSLAIAASVTRNKTIYYCLVDGQDTARIVSAYPEAFE